MSEQDLGKALLELDAHRLTGGADTRELTGRILERDRSRVWWWTVSTFALWAAAIGMVMAMMVAFALVFPLQAKLHGRADQPAAAVNPSERLDLDNLTPEQRTRAQFDAQIMFQMVTVGVTVSVGITCLAVLASLMLSRASRRATLRQINASLLEISQQLKELKEQAPAPKP